MTNFLSSSRKLFLKKERKNETIQNWREEAEEEPFAEMLRHQNLRGDESLVAVKWTWVGAAKGD